MLHLILYEPEIPPNTGNIIRLCANTGFRLHLVKPLGFALSDRELRRAGLDYHEYAELAVHDSLAECREQIGDHRLLAFSTRGGHRYSEVGYADNDALLFGPETRGLPQELLESLPAEQRLRIPLRPGNRSLNLSNAAAVAVYEAWRQRGFSGGG